MRTRNILILLTILLVLGGYFYFAKAPQASEEKPKLYVWLIDLEDITHIKIELPSENKSEAFIKIKEEDKFPWHFDDPQRSKVDEKRWGGGIPLLLSGPGADRVIARNATPEQLAKFGLTQPSIQITLTLADDKMLDIIIGDKTPDSNNFYVKAPDSSDVATVDISWYNVIAGLAKEPPYASPPTPISQ